MDTVVIIPAAGKGKRLGANCNKLLLSIGNQSIIKYTIDLFLKHPRIDCVYLVIAADDKEIMESIVSDENKIKLVFGGAERQDSVFNALKVIHKNKPKPRWILIHDGARPCCPSSLIDDILAECEISGAAIPLLPIVDTIRQIKGNTVKIVERSVLFATQTPQGFDAELILEAYLNTQNQGKKYTDDAAIVEQYGVKVSSVEGYKENIKVTTPFDLKIAKWNLLNSGDCLK